MCTSAGMHQAINVNESQVNRKLFYNIKNNTICNSVAMLYRYLFCMVIFVFLRTWRTRCSPVSNPRVQQHTDGLSREPAHSRVRAGLLLLFFHRGWWGQWDEYQPLNTRLSTYGNCLLVSVLLFVNKAPSFVWNHSLFPLWV